MIEVLKVIGKYKDISGSSAESFRDDLLKIENEIDDDLTVDLEGIDQISSIGLSALFSTYNSMAEHGRKMSVVNACEKNMKIFEMMNMLNIVKDK